MPLRRHTSTGTASRAVARVQQIRAEPCCVETAPAEGRLDQADAGRPTIQDSD